MYSRVVSRKTIIITSIILYLGINLRKAEDMEDVLSNLLKTDREHRRSRLMPTNTSHPPIITTTSDHNEVTHAWVLEQCKYSATSSTTHFYSFLYF